MSIRSRLIWGVWVFLAAFAVEVSAQQPAPQPKVDPSPRPFWLPDGWEEWVGSISAGKFEFERLPAEMPGHAPRVMEREALHAKHAKAPTFVRLVVKREKDGSFAGTISYPSGLRSFALKVSGRIDEKNRATFTEEIDPKNVPQWHPWPSRFTGAVDGASWKGEVFYTNLLHLSSQRP